MTQISKLISTDSRPLLNRVRRPQLQRILKANGIEFDITGPATMLRTLIEANGINFMNPEEWDQIPVKDENGNTSIEMYPKVKEHATAKKNIDYSGIIEKKAKETMDAQLQKENEDLRDQLKTLTEMVESLMGQSSPDPKPSYSAMKMSELRKIAKERGIKTSVKTKKVELIEILNG